MNDKDRLKQVSKAHPCPVCGKGDSNCSRGARLILCRKSQGPVPGFEYKGQSRKDSQWAIYLFPKDDPPPQSGTHTTNGQAIDWQARAEQHARAFTPERRRQLAEALGLPEAVLAGHGIGYLPQGPHQTPEGEPLGPCFTFPLHDGFARVVGLLCRYRNGQKKVMARGRGGLFLPAGWKEREGSIFLVEGPSDTLAMTALNLPAIGRFNNTAGAEDLAELLREVSPDRLPVVVGEWDMKDNGTWPGKEGAEQLALTLEDRLSRPVCWVLPPNKWKDVRAWVLARGLPRTGEASTDDWEEAGQELLTQWEGKHQRTGPSNHSADNGKAAGTKKPVRLFPEPIPASRLRPDTEAGTHWRWKGLIAKAGFTLFSAYWKAGKTTLLAPLLHTFAHGGIFCGLEVSPARVLYVTEEPQGLWAERRDRLGIGDHVHFLPMKFLTKPTPAEWRAFVEYLADWQQKLSADLVFLDTLTRFWPVRDENSAGEVTEALLPLQKITEAAGLVSVCHLRKGDGQEGTATRGSGALLGFVNVILELRRFNPADRTCRKRVLTAYGHYQEVPQEEIVVELNQEGTDYQVHGSRQQWASKNLRAILAPLLPGEPPGLNWEQVKAKWPEDPSPGKQKLLDALNAGAGDGDWKREGSGAKGSAYTFWRPAS
jgi:hypothetical protein